MSESPKQFDKRHEVTSEDVLNMTLPKLQALYDELAEAKHDLSNCINGAGKMMQRFTRSHVAPKDCPTCGGDGKLTDQPGTFKACSTCGGCGKVVPFGNRQIRADYAPSTIAAIAEKEVLPSNVVAEVKRVSAKVMDASLLEEDLFNLARVAMRTASALSAMGTFTFTIPSEPRVSDPCEPDIHPSAGGGRICWTCTGFGVDGQPLRCVRTGKNVDENNRTDGGKQTDG